MTKVNKYNILHPVAPLKGESLKKCGAHHERAIREESKCGLGIEICKAEEPKRILKENLESEEAGIKRRV